MKNRTKHKKTSKCVWFVVPLSQVVSKYGLVRPEKGKTFFLFRMASFRLFIICCSLFFGAFWERTPYKLRDHICSCVHAPLSRSVYIQMQI